MHAPFWHMLLLVEQTLQLKHEGHHLGGSILPLHFFLILPPKKTDKNVWFFFSLYHFKHFNVGFRIALDAFMLTVCSHLDINN